MSLWKIAWRSIEQRALASALTAFAMGLGVALVVAVLVIHGVIDRSFKRGSQGYDLIVGAKGSSLQLVLNTVFHLSESVETIPYSYYRELRQGRFHAAVETAVPVCMGHAYKDCVVVATNRDMFDKLTYLDKQRYRFAEGRNFETTHPFEAVIGSVAARKTGLKIGDTFSPQHTGQDASDEDDKHHKVTVVGILEHTGTPNDRAIFMNLEGFYQFGCHTAGPGLASQIMGRSDEPKPKPGEPAEVPGVKDDQKDSQNHAEQDAHGHEGHAEHMHGTPLEQRRLTAVLVCTNYNNRKLAMGLADEINRETVAQAVAPSRVIDGLFEGIVGNVQLVLLILACLGVVVAGVGFLVSIYNSMSDRRHEIAVMRALGASRFIVGMIILLESILLSLGGGAFGVLLGHGLVGALGPTIAEQTGVLVHAWSFQLNELVLIPGLIVLASIVGYVPAVVAYRTDVAKSLTTAQ